MTDFDSAYAGTPDLFGSEPTPLLSQYASHIPHGWVLDVGVGQGRNALMLARLGYRVVGIDTSQVAVDECRRRVRSEGLSVEIARCSIFDFQAPHASFQAVLLFGLLQMLSRPDIVRVATISDRLLVPGGLLFVTAWHTDDPAHQRIKSEWLCIGSTSYRSADGEIRTYFGPGELPGLLPGWQLIHHTEGMGPIHRHGNGPPEQHGVVNLVAQKGN
jgi:tellurite methyltransferase